MTDRQHVLTGLITGAVWGILLIWIGATMVNIPPFSRILIQPFFALAPGLVLLALIVRHKLRCVLSGDPRDADAPAPGTPADIDRRVLHSTVEQTVLALCLWPPISYLLLDDGLGVVLCLSVGFALSRLAYWAGYHYAAPLRAFGMSATVLPTLMALVWGLFLRLT